MKTIVTIIFLLSFILPLTGQLKMNSNSNVGIGTLTPQELFHVKGGNISIENGKLGIDRLSPAYELDVDGVVRFNGLQNTTDLIWDKSNSRLLIA